VVSLGHLYSPTMYKLTILFFLFGCNILFAQQSGGYPQRAIGALQDLKGAPLERLPVMSYRVQPLTDNLLQNAQVKTMLQLLNRDQLSGSKDIVVPSVLNLDLRAYAPYPRYYPGGQWYPKLFISHLNTQTYAAYEFGRLIRWGVMTSGSSRTPTPEGRYNFNWREEFRISADSPPGQQWKLYWVTNFNLERGIHTHESPDVILGGPASHGCVRMIQSDAKWVYHWADLWEYDSPKRLVKKQGNLVLVVGENPNGKPDKFFVEGTATPKQIWLPDVALEQKPGSDQQYSYDRRRNRQSRYLPFS
jgi:L,D-transpeptidase catalytic domain